MGESYGSPRASRTGGRTSGGAPAYNKNNGNSDNKSELVNIGGGWKKDWGYSCVLQIGNRKYKALAFWNKFRDGNNPPDLSFSLRAEEIDGEESEPYVPKQKG
jgi:hypothetical protein|tara:strand:+ start:3644 stop:3952 length:309 start_codon:yes stop_codon:yes gene_type:complete